MEWSLDECGDWIVIMAVENRYQVLLINVCVEELRSQTCALCYHTRFNVPTYNTRFVTHLMLCSADFRSFNAQISGKLTWNCIFTSIFHSFKAMFHSNWSSITNHIFFMFPNSISVVLTIVKMLCARARVFLSICWCGRSRPRCAISDFVQSSI